MTLKSQRRGGPDEEEKEEEKVRKMRGIWASGDVQPKEDLGLGECPARGRSRKRRET